VKRSKNKSRIKRDSSQDLIEAISPHAIAHGVGRSDAAAEDDTPAPPALEGAGAMAEAVEDVGESTAESTAACAPEVGWRGALLSARREV
jgi:hypothetical protein